MYVLDDRYVTVVAFIEGFNLAHDGALLKGFQEWVCERILGGQSGRHWAPIVAAAKYPPIVEEGLSISQIPQDLESCIIDTLLDLLEEFSEQSRNSVSSEDV